MCTDIHRHNETNNRSSQYCSGAKGHVTIKKKPFNYRPAYWVTFRQRSNRDNHCFTLIHRDCRLEKRLGCQGRGVMRNEVGGGVDCCYKTSEHHKLPVY